MDERADHRYLISSCGTQLIYDQKSGLRRAGILELGRLGKLKTQELSQILESRVVMAAVVKRTDMTRVGRQDWVVKRRQCQD